MRGSLVLYGRGWWSPTSGIAAPLPVLVTCLTWTPCASSSGPQDSMLGARDLVDTRRHSSAESPYPKRLSTRSVEGKLKVEVKTDFTIAQLLGRLRSDDLYHLLSHYPETGERSTALATQVCRCNTDKCDLIISRPRCCMSCCTLSRRL